MPEWFADGIIEYRIAPWTLSRHLPGFRPLRENEAWHREDFTEAMLPEGWRPLLATECHQAGDQWSRDGMAWTNCGECTSPASSYGSYAFYRRPRPLPKPPRMVPLSRADIPYGSWLRTAFGGDRAILAICDDGVDMGKGLATWDALQKSGTLIIRPGQPPAPCEKPAPTL